MLSIVPHPPTGSDCSGNRMSEYLCYGFTTIVHFKIISVRGTGMIASGSTFRLYPGRIIRDLFRLLNAVYGIVRKH